MAPAGRRGEEVEEAYIHGIFTYVQVVVYIRAILSQNIKRDCMADLCKYLWPANKRVLAEPKRKAEGG